MAYKLNIRGIEVTAGSAEEVAALIRKFTEAEPVKIGRPPKSVPVRGGLFPDTPSPEEQMAHAFLFRIASAGPKGATSEEIMEVLKVEAGRGIGGRCVKINNILARHGFTDPEQIYVNPRLAEGRVWRPGPKIHEAMTALKNGR